MNEQEKFDDLLRSRLSEERDFPFDETNWDKAEVMIDRSEKRRRYGIIAAVFFTGLMAGILLMIPFLHTNTNNISSTAQTTPYSQQNTIAANRTPDKAPIQSGTIPASANSTTVQQQPNQTAGNNSTTTNNTLAKSQPIASANTSETKTKNNTTAQSGDNSFTTKHHKRKHVNTDSIQQYSYVRPVSKKTKKITTLNDVATNNAAITKMRREENANTTEGNSSQLNNTVEPSTAITAQTTTAITQQQDTLNKTQPVVTTINPVTKNDSGKTVTPTNNNTTPQQQPQQNTKYTHNILSIDAGAGYSFGWQKEGETQGSGISPVFGFSITHYFSTNVSARIGLQYNSLTNLNTLYSGSTSQYDFGSINNVTSVTLKTLYYAALPVQFQFNLSSNDIIGVGANVLYLVNSNSNVISYSQNYFGTSGYTSADKTGYMDGINNLDAQLTLAYRRRINRFTISVEGYYGLFDIENNGFFNNNVFERNSGLRAILSFDIIK